MEDIKIIEGNNKEYAVMRLRSLAEVVGLVPEGTGTRMMKFPVLGYEESPDGGMVPLLGIGMVEDKKKEIA